VKHFGLTVDGRDDDPLPKLPRGNLSAVAIARAICRYTILPRRWTAERLSRGSAGNVSEQVRRFALIEQSKLTQELRGWKNIEF